MCNIERRNSDYAKIIRQFSPANVLVGKKVTKNMEVGIREPERFGVNNDIAVLVNMELV